MTPRRLGGLGAAIISIALLASACSGSSGNDDSPSASGPSKGIVSSWGTEPQGLIIPTNINEVGGGKIVDLVFAGLVYYDKDGKSHNEVADSIETEDSQTYTIKLKSGWKFSNGEAVTAKSFVDAWQYGALLSNKQLSSTFFQGIEGYSDTADSPLTGLKVVDDSTFTVTLKQPEADFPLRLGYSAYYPLPSVAFEDMNAFGEKPIGNGPYLMTKWSHKVNAEFAPNPDYKGGRMAQNGGVNVKFYLTQEAAYQDLLAGQVDVLEQIPDSAFGSYESDLPDRNVNQAGAVFQSFTIPQKLAHFEGEEGKLRREALSLAIDRDLITDKIFDGTRTPAKDFTSPVIGGWKDDIEGSDILTYDPDKAKELWAKADEISPWSGKFTIGYNADGGHQGWVDAVCNSLKKTLEIDAQGAPYPTFQELRDDITNRTIKGAFRSGWQADYPSTYNFLGPLYGTGAGSNDGDYSSAKVDDLLKEGLAAPSVDDANEKFYQVETQLFEDLPAIPLWYQNSVAGWSDKVSNVTIGWNSQPLLQDVRKN